MKKWKLNQHRKTIVFAAVFLAVNIAAVLLLSRRESAAIHRSLTSHAQETQGQFGQIMEGYERSFELFSLMMRREIKNNEDPDAVLAFLKQADAPLLNIEGDTFDGLYLYYKGRYLYSWDTPYSVYEDSGYVATERPWYQAAVQGAGDIVFTPPYMSYANHYILTTISQLQPDGETVFAYDIKMGDIQKLVSTLNEFDGEQIFIFDGNGTVIGSTNADYLGGDLDASMQEVSQAVQDAQAQLDALENTETQERAKAQDQLDCAKAFHRFREEFGQGLERVTVSQGQAVPISIGSKGYYGLLQRQGDYQFLILAPVGSLLMKTVTTWLVPLLLTELLLIYILGRISKGMENRELKAAYVELGQMQKRLQLALTAAQKAAAIDDLTGMMNFKSFRKGLSAILESMEDGETGILIMIDGDHFKQVNDNYGHSVGDEVIKLSAQMIIGRIRTVDLASRLHGDEFAIFIANSSDYEVARRIMEDINSTIAREASKRKVPAITLSAGAVIARQGDSYTALAKEADEALYRAKETHDGGFAHR